MDQKQLALHVPLAEHLTIERANEFARLSEGAKDLLVDAKSAATRRAYKQDWSDFESWCAELDRVALPADTKTVTAYVRHLFEENQKSKTIGRVISALAFVHRAKAIDWKATHDAAIAVLGGARRRRAGTERVEKKNPVTPALLQRLIRALTGSEANPVADARDRAILLTGWTGAFRRSELVALDVADLEFTPDGDTIVHIRKSKTDQEGKGATKVLPKARDPELCATAALQLWLTAAEIDEGAVFRGVTDVGTVRKGRLSDRSVAEIVKRTATRAGLSERLMKALSGHSLRSGFITEARRKGRGDHEIMQQSGHKSREMLDEYTHVIDQVKTSAARGLL
jgi:site-specific recombinase XerD